MKAFHEAVRHITVILSLMFAVFLVLDIYNPLMNFVDNDLSRVLLALLCIGETTNVLLDWRQAPAAKRQSLRTHSEEEMRNG